MTHAPSIPEHARCRKCGYALRGLPRSVCPECGRPFDPADPHTFDSTPPGWRRKRWIKRAVGTLALVAALWAVFPRGVMQSTISFTCADCGHIDRVRRLELRPPAGMPFRYPGITLTDEQNGPSAHSAFSHANYRADVKSDLFCRGTVTGWADCSTSSPCEVNGLLATLQSAPILLEEMLSRTNSGIQIGDGK